MRLTSVRLYTTSYTWVFNHSCSDMKHWVRVYTICSRGYIDGLSDRYINGYVLDYFTGAMFSNAIHCHIIRP